MRVAIVTEAFLPTINGVSNSVARVTEELEELGHTVLIICPGKGPSTYSKSRVHRTPSVPIPGYNQIPVGVPTEHAYSILEKFDADIMHVGGPVALGAWGLAASKRLSIPAVALFQTDLAAFARHYRFGVTEPIIWRWLREVHDMPEFTLAPSSATAMQLRRNGFRNVKIWGRGVDLQMYDKSKRSEKLRSILAPNGETIVGYVGRLAPEKNVTMLKALRGMNDIKIVIVGDGPDKHKLQKMLPNAYFAGYKGGEELAEIYASLDIFIHTGNHETFCQTIQEAQASSVPVIAPASGGPLDLIKHRLTGLHFRPNNKRALINNVRWLVENPGERERMGAAGAKRVATRSWANMTLELVDHYKAAIKRFTERNRKPSIN